MPRLKKSFFAQIIAGLMLSGSAALVPASNDSGGLPGAIYGGSYGDSYASHAGELEIAGVSLYRETEREMFLAGLLLPPERDGANPLIMAPPRAMEYRIAAQRLDPSEFSASILLQAEHAAQDQPPESVTGALSVINRRLKGSLRHGDQFAIYHSRQNETVFLLNNQELHRITGSSAFDFFLNGWAAKDADANLANRFRQLAPTVDRVAVVRGWLAVPPGAERGPGLPVTMRRAVEPPRRTEAQTSSAMKTDARRSRDAVL